MIKRSVVCVATTPYYQRGQRRLRESLYSQDVTSHMFYGINPKWPSHEDKPYAFKAFSLKQEIEDNDPDLMLWADACMLPVADMTPLWERIERDGYWMSRNGYTNYEWTADSAYMDLLPGFHVTGKTWMESVREVNKHIPHVVATCFGLNVRHPKGRAFLDEYYRLASETRAFCGPWTNANAHPDTDVGGPPRVAPCGPADVRGHRHDQTAASVIAWRLGFQLTDPPEIFAYGKSGEQHDPRTIMIADGSYT